MLKKGKSFPSLSGIISCKSSRKITNAEFNTIKFLQAIFTNKKIDKSLFFQIFRGLYAYGDVH